MRGQGTSFARLTQVLGAVAQSGSAPRSHRGGQGFKSPQLHRERSSRFGWVYIHVSGKASVPAFPRRRIWQMPGAIATAFPLCGQREAPLSMWAVPQPALILPAQG